MSYLNRLMAAALAVFVLCPAAIAHGTSKGDLVLDHPYATPSLSGVNKGAAYLRSIQNRGDVPDRLLRASTPVAARVELHYRALEAGVMRMHAVPSIELPAGKTTPLRHNLGTHHLMLMDLKQPLRDGDRFDMTLTFERAGTQTVRVWVQTPRDLNTNDHKH